MRKVIFIILILLWSGLAITLMNDGKEPSGREHEKLIKAETHSTYRPQSDRS
jgi:hypothetical protein